MATNPRDFLIGGTYEVDPAQPLDGAGGGLEVFAALDRRGGGERLMAVRVPDGMAPRAPALKAFAGPVPFCLIPLAHGVARDAQGRAAQFVICPAPPGPALAVDPGARWSEQDVLETLLRPVAAALAGLQARHVTHRAIRPGNVFQAARGQPAMLGCAWAAAPAQHQPALYEPPYSAGCSAGGCDDGVIADDVYALGVLMVVLSCGAPALDGLTPEQVVARKLSLGSAAAIISDVRLPPMIADLARGMLAEDPEHRPSPALLADPEAARTRRVAARPRRRAQRPIEVGGQTAWDARSLAHVLATEPAHAVLAIRGGAVDNWLRRGLGDSSLALVLEEAVRQRAADGVLEEADSDAILLMRAVAFLDPLAPLCWRGIRLWPAALGALLAASPPAAEPLLARMIDTEALAAWALARAQRVDPMPAQVEARQLRSLLRQRGWSGGIARLRYTRAPLLPCRSSLFAETVVIRATEVLPALEYAAAGPNRPVLPLDAEISAFIAARLDARMDADFTLMGRVAAAPADLALAQLRVLARLQSRPPAPAVPLLAAWLAAPCEALLGRLRNQARRAGERAALQQQVTTGRLGAVLALLDNPAILAADQQEADAAAVAIARLDAEIADTDRRLGVSRTHARRMGREIAGSVGIMALAAAIVLALL